VPIALGQNFTTYFRIKFCHFFGLFLPPNFGQFFTTDPQVGPRELEMTSNSTIPEVVVPQASTINFGPELHSTLNRSYTNTYSSCGSFTLPSIIGTIAAWPCTVATDELIKIAPNVAKKFSQNLAKTRSQFLRLLNLQLQRPSCSVFTSTIFFLKMRHAIM
jgi:hypothetical protein